MVIVRECNLAELTSSRLVRGDNDVSVEHAASIFKTKDHGKELLAGKKMEGSE
jgi:hypothetical protein